MAQIEFFDDVSKEAFVNTTHPVQVTAVFCAITKQGRMTIQCNDGTYDTEIDQALVSHIMNTMGDIFGTDPEPPTKAVA